jgi:hypothetical protein
LDDECVCLGYGVTSIPRGAGWRRDSFHDHSWPLAYFPRIDFVAEGIRCDVKVPWELSRMQFLIGLAEGAIFEPESAAGYRSKFEDIVLDWIESNPVAYGVNWCCAMEVAIRAINLSLAFSVFADGLCVETSERIISALDDHTRFIARFPEKSDVAGNHYLADLAGAAFVPAVLGNTDAASRALDAFTEEAERQFEPEGFHIERAPIYHRLCLDLVACMAAMAIRLDHLDKNRLLEIVDRGVELCRSIASIDGQLPVIGDCDSGHVLLLSDSARDFSGLDQFACRATGRRSAVTADLAHWLLAAADVAESAAPALYSAPRRPVAATDSQGGYLVARAGDLSVVMRAGPHGLRGRASHDHDDALSLWVNKCGRDVLAEEGCFSYTLDPNLRTRNIASSAHNVVQARGVNRYGLAPGSISRSARGAPTASEWSHQIRNGMPSLSAALAVPVRAGQAFTMCRRVVTLTSSSSFCVEDAWALKHAGAAEILWHLGPGLRPQPGGTRDMKIGDESGEIAMTVAVETDATTSLETFDYEYSPVYGATSRNFGLRIVVGDREPTMVRTVFRLGELSAA